MVGQAALRPPFARPPGSASLQKFVEGFLLRLRSDAFGSGVDPRDLVGVPCTASLAVPWGRIPFVRLGVLHALTRKTLHIELFWSRFT